MTGHRSAVTPSYLEKLIPVDSSERLSYFGLRINPNFPAPTEVLRNIQEVGIPYIDMNGNTQRGVLEMHRDTIHDVRDFFKLACNVGFPIEEVVKSSDDRYRWNDDVLMAGNATSGFNYRLIKGSEVPSLHGLGRAFDVNPAFNPYIRFVETGVEIDPPGADYDPSQPGTLYSEHPLVCFMKSRGWRWGGDWSIESGRVDYQHFELPEQ